MSERRICYILPSYSHFDYVWPCVASYFRHAAQEDICLVVDDASPDWDQADVDKRTSDNPRLVVLRFEKNGGLTRSWNMGLQTARDLGFTYAVCGNSDVLFSPGWQEPLLYWLANAYNLVGPVSNAPGVTAGKRQDVATYLPDYKLSDQEGDIAAVAQALSAKHHYTVASCPINGFFMMARTDDWWRGCWDQYHVFRPRNDRAPSGRINPTPLMTCNEDELQGRWFKMGLRYGVCAGSFIFHYRAVSRGDRHRRGKWMRRAS